jgi:two-component system, NtrC family, response regulator HydG
VSILTFGGMDDEDALRGLADALPDGLFTTDPEGRVTFWSKGAERITGWSAEEALGQSCSLLAGDVVNGCISGEGPLRCGLAVRGYSSRRCNARAKDGRLVLLVKKAVPLYDGDRLIGALETFTDVGTVPLDARRCEGVGDPEREPHAAIVGSSEAMLELKRMIELFGRSDSNVLIHGESGVGKDLVAEAIHAGSRRSTVPLLRVSCTAGTDAAIEAELFGEAGGAGEGALGRASDGAVLLDGIDELSPRLQARLLRMVEERIAEAAPGQRPSPARARLFCMTREDLRRRVAMKEFRADLYYRLSTLTVEVPPLRARGGDVCVLARWILGCPEPIPGQGAKGDPKLAPDAVRALEAYDWPGNVRELKNVLEHAALRAGNGPILREHLPSPVAETGRPARHVEANQAAIVGALTATGGNRAEAARRLGISRVTLWKRMKRLGIDRAGPA